MRLQGEKINLAVLEREDCRKLWQDNEYDFEHPTEEFNIGYSVEKADEWFEEIQKCQGSRHVRLGIFLNDGTVIGDVALQDIDRKNRKCSLGLGIAKIGNRANGYGREAARLVLDYGFRYLGMERISANTLEMNAGAQRVLECCGFTLEGRERKAVYLNGEKYDRLCYGILKEEHEKAVQDFVVGE